MSTADLGKLCFKYNNGSLAYKHGNGSLIYKAQPNPGIVKVEIEMYPLHWKCYAHDNHAETTHTATLSCQFVLVQGAATITKTSDITYQDTGEIYQIWEITPVPGAQITIQVVFSSTAEKDCATERREFTTSGVPNPEYYYVETGPVTFRANVSAEQMVGNVWSGPAGVNKSEPLNTPFAVAINFDSLGNLESLT